MNVFEGLLVILSIAYILLLPLATLILLIVVFRRMKELQKRVDALTGMGFPAKTTHPASEPASIPRGIDPFGQKPGRLVAGANWEDRLVKEWLPRIGMLAILFGLGFFLKYAFDHRWLSDGMKVILGILSGIGFISVGEYFQSKNRYPGYRSVLSGGGIAILYLSSFAAFNLYHLIPRTAAFLFMVLTTLTSGVISSKRKLPVIAMIGLLGGLLTPVLLSTHEDPGLTLLVYLLILDTGTLWFSKRHQWRYLDLISLSGTIVLAIGWQDRYGSNYIFPYHWLSMAYPVFIFLLYTGSASLQHVKRQVEPRVYEILSFFLTPTYTFIAGYAVIDRGAYHVLGFYCLLLAAIYLALATVHRRLNPEHPVMLIVFGTLAASFIMLAVPIQLDGFAIPLLWAVEGAAFAAIGLRLKNTVFKVIGNGLVMLAMTGSVLMETSGKYQTAAFRPVFNTHFLTFAMILGSVYSLIWFYKRKTISEVKGLLVLTSFWLVTAQIYTVWKLSFEIYRSIVVRAVQPSVQSGLASVIVTLFLTLYSIILIVIGIRLIRMDLKVTAACLFAVAVLKLFIFDLSTVDILYRVFGGIGFGVIALTASYVYYRLQGSQPSAR